MQERRKLKTDDLINALTEDASRPAPLWRTTAFPVTVGIAIALVALLTIVGLRVNLLAAAQTWQFQFKMAVFMSMALVTAADFWRLMRPGAWQVPVGVVLAAIILAASAVYALTIVPAERWQAHLYSGNLLACMMSIPLLATAPLIAAFIAMRSGAPASPTVAGLAAGGFAACISAALYATHCPADTPIFYAVWYSLGGLSVMIVGAAIGPHLLKW
jgi:hypothetical protein